MALRTGRTAAVHPAPAVPARRHGFLRRAAPARPGDDAPAPRWCGAGRPVPPPAGRSCGWPGRPSPRA
ncbi:hypothetical protein G6F55_014700 [Rhizopus delemar]|nr:hypothetical protein G6F55_014700 [Rhizopus delemar]